MRKLSVSGLVLTSILLLASPALAHNDLLEQSPSGQSVVDAGSFQVKLRFSEEPIPTKFGEGNLIAIARADTGEQLGPACARIEGTSLVANINIQDPGEYKILWRTASEDGHIASGEYLIEVENNTGYTSDRIGNQCFDQYGVELKFEDQSPLSEKKDPLVGFLPGLIWGAALIIIGGAIGASLVQRRKSVRKP